jgi:type IV pilus assembly protein PilQ
MKTTKTWNKTTKGLIFLAAMSVYPLQANGAGAEKRASGAERGTEVRLLDETSGPVAAADPAKPVAAPAGNGGAKPNVSVSDTGTVEIHVNDASLVEVLNMLSMQAQKNIVASKEVRGTVTANLYNVTVKEALDAILKANGYAYREKGNFIYVYSNKELADLDKQERQTTAEVFRLHYTPAANAANMIKPVLSADGQVALSAIPQIGLDNKETGGNLHATDDVIVVRDFPENMERVRKVIRDLDKRPQQVMVEATIIAARLNDDNNLGIDFNIVGGVDFSSFLHNAGQIVGGELPEGDGVVSKDKVSSVGTGNTFSSKGKSGFKVGFLGSNVSVFVNALEEVTDTAVLANPKVLTLNKNKGEILVGREDGYLTTTVTESTTVQTVEFLQTGTRLVFRPFIGDDGYVRMEVHPEDSDGSVVGGLPRKTTTEVTTNIMVKDGHTVVIGGLFRESSSNSRSQVPGLGTLPVVGALFRHQNDTTVREEIIVLLTPHIVKDDRAFSEGAEDARKDMEKLRVGVRKGMMFWSRERLSDLAYNEAVKEMNSPNPNRRRALWHLDCATNANPKFLEAIKMKEALTGRELTTVDNSTIRGFLRRQIMAERAPAGASADFNRGIGGEIRFTAATSSPIPFVPAMPWAFTAPTTRPVAADATADATAAPTTRPVTDTATAEAEVAAPTTRPVVATTEERVEAPATQPNVTVTEVPTEPLVDDEQEIDD